MRNGLPRKTSSATIITTCLGIIVMLCLIVVLCLPAFFSTITGKKILLKMISHRTGFEIEIEELSLSWFGSQKALGVHAQKPQDHIGFTAQEVQTDSPLWKLAFFNDVGNLQIFLPNLQINKPFQPTAQLHPKSPQAASFAVQPRVTFGMRGLDLPLQGKITVKEGKVELNSPGLDPIVFDQIALSLDRMQKDQLGIVLNCNTSQQGKIALQGTASHLRDPFPNLSVQSTIHQLPVRGIDQVLTLFSPQMNGVLYSSLGATINLECQLNAHSGNFDLRLNALSPQMTAYIATQSLNGILSLKSPAEFNFNMTPVFVKKLAKFYPSLSQVTLTEPSLLQTTVEQFSCPIPYSVEDLLKSSFQAKISTPPRISLTLNGKALFLNGLHVTTQTSSLQQQLLAHLSTGLQTPSQTGAVTIECDLHELFSNALRGTVALNAQKFPVELFDLIPNASMSLSPLLGPAADFKALLSLQEGNDKLHLTWQSNSLEIPSLDLTLGNTFTLISPSPFTFVLNPLFLNPLLPQDQIQLVKAVPFQGTLQNLKFPSQQVKNTSLQLTLTSGPLALSGAFPLNIAKMQASLAINTLDQIDLQIEGQPLQLSLRGAYNPTTEVFTLTQPFSMQYAVDQPTFQTFAPSAPQIAKPALIQLSVDSFSLPLSGVDLLKMKLKGQLSTTEMILGPQAKQITLQNLSLPFQWDGLAKTASIQMSSQVQNPSGGNGQVQGQFNLSNFSTQNGLNLSSAAIQGSLDLQNISSSLIDIFSGYPFSALIGPTFTTKLKLQSALNKQNLAMKWTSSNLNADATFLIDSACLQMQGGNNQMTWTLTPESYKVLDQMLAGSTQGVIPFELKSPSTFSIAFSKLSLPTFPPQMVNGLADRIPNFGFDLAKLQLTATARNPSFSFFDRSSQETISLTNLNLSLNKSEQSPLGFSLDSTIMTQAFNTANTKNGSLSVSGKLEQTLTPQGVFDFSQLTGGLQLKAQQLPSRALDIIARAKGRTDLPFSTLFGNVINTSLNIDLNKFSGPVSLNINSPLTRADISGVLKKGVLTLNNDIHVQMKITPEVSRLVLKEVNPLNLSYIYSQEPVTLQIPASGFYFPLYPFNLAQAVIPKGSIELGKIACRNEGNVNIALGLLKTKQFEKNKDLTLWFAPVDFSMRQGSASIERTEILLADVFDICLWGKIDLVQDYIDMVLGLTAQTLNKAFGIKNLPENYVLTIPMRGKADNVQIDTSKATTKVAMLLAWQQAGAGLGKTPGGALIGGLLNKMATLPDSDIQVPPPKHPFPWEVGKKSKTSHESHEKKRQFKLNEKPLKQILKLIK